MNKMLKWHKESVNWWQKKLDLTNYAMYWVSFLKGIIIVLLILWLI